MGFLKANWRLIAVALAVVGVWFVLRTPSAPLDSIADLDARLGRGEPLVLQFFANT